MLITVKKQQTKNSIFIIKHMIMSMMCLRYGEAAQ